MTLVTKQPTSLRQRFKRLAVRWSLTGAVVSLVLMVPMVSYAVKHSSERQVEVMAKALTRAFRPMILEGDIRGTIPQVEEVANLKDHESVEIVDTNYKTILETGLNSHAPEHCPKADTICWLNGIGAVAISKPIYFGDSPKSELFGYLILKMSPTIDWIEILLIIFAGTLIYLFQMRGLYSALRREAQDISSVLTTWKSQIDNPKGLNTDAPKEFLLSEFVPLDNSVKALRKKVEELEDVAAIKAKTEIIRGIGHDLKTPLAQLARFFEVFVHNTKTNGNINGNEVQRINGVLTRMGNLIREVTHLDRGTNQPSEVNLGEWLGTYVSQLKDQRQGDVRIDFVLYSDFEKPAIIRTDETNLFRLVDNIVRNGIDAFPDQKTGSESIRISLNENESEFELQISDNGSGIPENIQDRIFDLDFSTKKSRGTGLGLGIVKNICTGAGLRLDFYSKLGHGTLFKVAFPKGASVQ